MKYRYFNIVSLNNVLKIKIKRLNLKLKLKQNHILKALLNYSEIPRKYLVCLKCMHKQVLQSFRATAAAAAAEQSRKENKRKHFIA